LRCFSAKLSCSIPYGTMLKVISMLNSYLIHTPTAQHTCKIWSEVRSMMQRAKLPESSTTRERALLRNATMLDDAISKEYGNVQCMGGGWAEVYEGVCRIRHEQH
jgi:hypothetical protein